MVNGKTLERGWFVLRVGIGMMFMVFGWSKITGGPDKWKGLGGAMQSAFGIGFAPVFWGFMAAFAEFFGGLALLLGLLVRPFAILMAFTMITAVASLAMGGKGFGAYAHALDMAIVFVAMVIGGGGCCTLGARLRGLAGRWYQ